jgi:hypothetical protein
MLAETKFIKNKLNAIYRFNAWTHLETRGNVGRTWHRWTPMNTEKNRIACNQLMKLLMTLVRRLLVKIVVEIYQCHIWEIMQHSEMKSNEMPRALYYCDGTWCRSKYFRRIFFLGSSQTFITSPGSWRWQEREVQPTYLWFWSPGISTVCLDEAFEALRKLEYELNGPGFESR